LSQYSKQTLRFGTDLLSCSPVLVLNIVTMEEVFLNVCDIIYGLF